MTAPLTPEERAEKMHDYSGCECQSFGREIHILWFAEQIKSACAEARKEGRLIGYKECNLIFKFSNNYADAVKEGFSSGYAMGREDAIGVVETYDAGCTEAEVVEKLRALTPPEEAKS